MIKNTTKLIIIFLILLLCFKVNLLAKENKYKYTPRLWYPFVQLEHFLPDPLGNLGFVYKVYDDLWYHNSKGDIYKLNSISNVSGIGYYVDYSNSDQGLIGNGKTIKAYVDLIGSGYATIILPHHESLFSQTRYTLNTNETIPSNITTRIEEGAYIDGTATLLDNGPLIAYKNCFGNNIDINFANGEDIIPDFWFIDGNSDDIEINKAIDSLTNGGIIKFLNDEYSLSNQILVNVGNITLDGSGNSILNIDANNVYGIYVDHFPNIKISNLEIKGTLNSYPSNNKSLIYRHYISSPSDDSQGFVIDNCIFSEYTAEAIYISTSSGSGNSIINNCRFEDTNNPSSIAIKISSSGLQRISNCFFREIQQGINLNSSGSGKTIITDNNFFDLEDYNIYVDTPGALITNNNFINYYSGTGIFIYLNSNSTNISNNYFFNWGGGSNGSIYLKSYNHSINNNIFHGSHSTEIYFDTAYDCKIINNIFKVRPVSPNSTWNSYLVNSQHIIFSNNIFGYNTDSGSAAVYIDSNCNNIKLLNNIYNNHEINYNSDQTIPFGTIDIIGIPIIYSNNINNGSLRLIPLKNDAFADDETCEIDANNSGILFVSIIDPNGVFTTQGGMWITEPDATVVKITGSANTADTDSDGNLCVYDGGSVAIIKNRMGDVGKVRAFYFYN